jgi:hypothetical protein
MASGSAAGDPEPRAALHGLRGFGNLFIVWVWMEMQDFGRIGNRAGTKFAAEKRGGRGFFRQVGASRSSRRLQATA